MSETQKTRKSVKLVAGILSAPKKAVTAVVNAPKAVAQEIRYFADDVKKEMTDHEAASNLGKNEFAQK